MRIWAVFANRSLQSLIGESIESAWEQATGGKPFPWGRVELHHIKEILEVMLPDVGLNASHYGFDYDEAASAYLDERAASEITARCDALFIDEAQDMGPNTLKLLSAIVRQRHEDDENSRAVNIFYDNAQNIYGRGTPKWSELGLDMRGRSTVMKESFRSTKPITEFCTERALSIAASGNQSRPQRTCFERTDRAFPTQRLRLVECAFQSGRWSKA